jgi:glycosyltransferase involved in cell wall biosynthesis
VKIAIVNPFEYGGGAEYQISLLIDALTATGSHVVHYLTHFVDNRARNRNYDVLRIGSGGPVPRLGYLVDGPALYGKLSEIGPDLIYQRVACAYTGICALYARRRAVPMVWHVAHDSDLASELLEVVRNKPRQQLEKWAVAYGARHAGHIVVQTEQQARLLRERYGRTPDAVVPNFHPPALEPIDKSGPLTVVWIANLKKWKQPEAFMRLAASFADRTDVRFIMIGAPPGSAGNPAWRESIMAGIKALPNLQYLGLQTHSEVNALLARAHIFVNTSLYEGFPNTFIQAWLRQAVVVSLSVDPDGVLEKNRVGIIAHSEAALQAAVRRLVENPETLADLARRGQEHGRAAHSLGNSRELVRLIETLGEGRQQGA